MANWEVVEKRLNEIDSEIFKNVDKNKLSEEEKRRMIYDFLGEHVTYDWDFLEHLIDIRMKRTNDTSRDPYDDVTNVLFNYHGVCHSISQVYRLLLELNGIYSLCVCCDNGLEVEHELNLVYDSNSDSYSFDDITSGIVGIASKDDLFGYDKGFAESIGQGKKIILPNNERSQWIFIPAAYLNHVVGSKSTFHKQFGVDVGYNYLLPENIVKLPKSNKK